MTLRPGWSTARAIFLLLSFPALACPQQPVSKNLQSKKGVDVTWGVKIPMRDGVKLSANVYKPKGMTEPQPVIFALNPYTAEHGHERAVYFAQNGYVFVFVNSRGRGDSEGSFEPYANEGRDGYDVAEWLARQPWSNGKVAMRGASYGGFTQWTTLKEFPPHLATIVPVAAGYMTAQIPLFQNIFFPFDMQWLTAVRGVTFNWKLYSDESFWKEKSLELYLEHLPFKKFDQVAGNPSAVFQKWLQHPTSDEYWDALAPAPDDYRRMRIPILTITGYYDEAERAAMTYYRRHMEYGSEAARAQHFLIIGPWDHYGTQTTNREVGGMKFGEATLLDMNELHKEWYDWTLKNGKKPEFLKKRVAYYVTGEEVWKYADSLEAISNRKLTFYLSSVGGEANDAFHSGTLSEKKPGEGPPDHYVYDPLDVRPGELEREEVKNYLTDQHYALNLFGNGLVYHSEPFEQDTEITGNLRFVARIAMDVPDTDFGVDVYEILLDGTSIWLTGDFMRARYRESLRQEKLVKLGEINRYEFNFFNFFSRRIAKGSRLRLVLNCINSIYWEKNYNGGGVVAEESGKDARTAHVTLYHDAEHPSFLELPLVK